MQLKIHINNIRGTQMAAKITGTVTLDENSFRFSAIAFGRIGGQNIGAKISKKTETQLKNQGYDVEKVILEIQKNLLQGNMSVPSGLKKESFADD